MDEETYYKNKAKKAEGGRAPSFSGAGAKGHDTLARRGAAVDLKHTSENRRQLEDFVASAKLTADSTVTATDRLRQLRERVGAKQPAALAGTTQGFL